MSIIHEQMLIFLRAIPVGATIMLLYDLFRILRRTFPHRDAVVFFEDIVFFLLAGMITWQYLLKNCRGELRAFVFAAELIGAVLWFLIVGKWMLAAGEWALRLLCSMVRIFVFCPLRWLYHLLYSMVIGILRMVWALAKILGAEKAICLWKKYKKAIQTAKNHLPEYAHSVYNFSVGLIMPFGRKTLNSEQEVESGAEGIIPSDR